MAWSHIATASADLRVEEGKLEYLQTAMLGQQNQIEKVGMLSRIED